MARGSANDACAIGKKEMTTLSSGSSSWGGQREARGEIRETLGAFERAFKPSLSKLMMALPPACPHRTWAVFRWTSPRHITLSEARSRLYRHRSLQVNNHFAAFFKIYKIFTILRCSNLKILQIFIKKIVILKRKKKLKFSSKSRIF